MTLELLDRTTIRAVDDAFGLGLDRDAAAMLSSSRTAAGAGAEDELDARRRSARGSGRRS